MRHDPRTEGFERLGGAYEARVLEPCPPGLLAAEDQRAAVLRFCRARLEALVA